MADAGSHNKRSLESVYSEAVLSSQASLTHVPGCDGENMPSAQRLLFQDLGAHIARLSALQLVCIVDQRVDKMFSQQLACVYQDARMLGVLRVSGGEDLKSFDGYRDSLHELLRFPLTRGTLLMAIGGGSVSDLAGFLAATLLRGLPWLAIPTTYLAMTDAAIGGKVGINVRDQKNRVGAFHGPVAVWLIQEFLQFYQKEDFQHNAGELLKYGLLDPAIRALLLARGSFPEEKMVAAMMSCVRYKEQLVAQDPYDRRGLRERLNLGHTFAHGLELRYGLSHSDAVYYGLIWEGAFVQDLCPNDQPQNTMALARALGLPIFESGSSLAEKYSVVGGHGNSNSNGDGYEGFLRLCLKDKKCLQEEQLVLVVMTDQGVQRCEIGYDQAQGILSGGFLQRLQRLHDAERALRLQEEKE